MIGASRPYILAKLPPEHSSPAQFQAWRVDAAAGQIFINLTAILAGFGSTYENLSACEGAIERLADHTLRIAATLWGNRPGGRASCPSFDCA